MSTHDRRSERDVSTGLVCPGWRWPRSSSTWLHAGLCHSSPGGVAFIASPIADSSPTQKKPAR